MTSTSRVVEQMGPSTAASPRCRRAASPSSCSSTPSGRSTAAFKTLEVKAPAGSIFDAKEPAACQWYFSSLGLLIDLVVTALSPVLPDKVAAAHFGDSMVRSSRAVTRGAATPVPLRDAARGRLGRVRGRRGRPDQQRQRRLQGLPRRGVRDQVPGGDPRLRFPPRHRRARTVPRRLRHLPPARRRARVVPLPLVRALGDARWVCSVARRPSGPT